MKIDDVLADEMIELCIGVGKPVTVEVQALAIAEIFKAGHIADRGVDPDVEILARCIGDFESEVGRVTTDIPLLQILIEPFAQLVGNLILQCARARPDFQHVLECWQVEEEMFGFLFYRNSP